MVSILENFARGREIGEQLRQAPQRQAMLNLGLEQEQLAMQRGLRKDERAAQEQMQSDELQKLTFANRAAMALRSLPDAQSRLRSAQQFVPFLESIGIDQSQLTPEAVSDQNLDEIIASTTAFIRDPEKIEAEKRRQEQLDIARQNLEQRQQFFEQAGEKSFRTKQGQLLAEAGEGGGPSKAGIAKDVNLAEAAAKISTEYFTQAGNVESNIGNMREAIKLIDQGAASGPIDKWFPSFKPATVALDNLKNRLGLDVIGQVTFGALSEKELQTAFDTAVPSNLRPDDLKKWFEERIVAQEKLLDALDEGANFLAQPGNTLPMLLAKRRQEAKGARQVGDQQQNRQPSIEDLVNQYAD